jgi:hypothetical protein
MVDAKGGFKQVPEQLAQGDVLFLFTDGIEDGLGEVARGMKGTAPPEGAPKEGAARESQPGASRPKAAEEAGQGMRRIYAVIDAVFNQRMFTLGGHGNTLLEPELEFDFTSASGSVEEAVLGLIAVEKVLRLQPAADAAEKDRVSVDRRVDAFLQKHYRGYGRHFSRKLPAAEEGETVSFSHLREDAQYDDLTILAIRKK